MIGGVDREVRGTAALPLNTWTHLAATYDGNVLALYVNGVQAATLLASGLDRDLDEPAQDRRQRDLGRVVQRADRRGAGLQPGADGGGDPGGHDAAGDESGCVCCRRRRGCWSVSGGLSSASLSWGAASDNMGVVRYNVHRGTTCGVHAVVGEPGRAADGDELHRYGRRRAATTTGSTAEDAAGNVGPFSNEAAATVGDTQAPSAPGTLSAVGSVGQATLSWGAATDNVGVRRYNVHRGTHGRLHARRRRTGSRSRPRPATSTRPRPAPTSTRSPPRTRPATSAPSRTRPPRPSPPTRPRPAHRAGSTAPVTGAPPTSAWTASTDNVAVVRYNVHRGSSAGFTPSAGNRIAQPTGTSYPDSGLATGTYFYKVTAEDAAGNISAASNEATATVADATPPSAPGTLTATAAGSTINLSWGAATDNVAVSRYNLHRGTTQRLHPHHRQPDRATDRAQLRRHRPRPRHLLLQAHRRRRRRQHRPAQQHRHRHRRRHHPAQHPHPQRQRRRRPNQPQLDRRHRQRRRQPLQPPPLHQQAASPPPPPTESPNPPAPATPTPASPPAPTTTSSPPKTPPATPAPPPTKPPPPSPPHPSPASSPPTASTPAPAPPSPTNPAPATTAPSPTPPGPAPATANTATPSPSTAPTPLATIPDANSLDLTTGMTLEAWVRPTDSRQHLPHRRDEGAAGQHGVRRSTPTAPGNDRVPIGEIVHRRLQRCGRHGAAAVEHLDASGDHLQRQRARALRQRRPGRPAPRRRCDHRVDEPAADRRQHHLGRVVPGRHRRGARLQPRPRRRPRSRPT